MMKQNKTNETKNKRKIEQKKIEVDLKYQR